MTGRLSRSRWTERSLELLFSSSLPCENASQNVPLTRCSRCHPSTCCRNSQHFWRTWCSPSLRGGRKRTQCFSDPRLYSVQYEPLGKVSFLWCWAANICSVANTELLEGGICIAWAGNYQAEHSELIREGRKCSAEFGIQVSCLASRRFSKLSQNAAANYLFVEQSPPRDFFFFLAEMFLQLRFCVIHNLNISLIKLLA